MTSINDLKSTISGRSGIARPNLFRIQLPTIPGVNLGPAELNILCRDVNIPGKQILTTERTIGTLTSKMAYGFASEDVSATFLVLNDYGIRKYFEAWQALALDPNTLEVGYKSDYSRDIEIYQLSNIPNTRLRAILEISLAEGINVDVVRSIEQTAIYKCKLFQAFPTTMQPIQLNNDADGIIELNVQFSYDRWTSEFLN